MSGVSWTLFSQVHNNKMSHVVGPFVVLNFDCRVVGFADFTLWHCGVMMSCLPVMKCKGFGFEIKVRIVETILLGDCNHTGN